MLNLTRRSKVSYFKMQKIPWEKNTKWLHQSGLEDPKLIKYVATKVKPLELASSEMEFCIVMGVSR